MKRKVVCQIGKMLCSLSLVVATYSTGFCRKYFYQPKEPSGLKEFVERGKKAGKN